jgi:alanine dehydrogenase
MRPGRQVNGADARPRKHVIGVPREVKNHEYRVALTPAGVRELAARGHEVLLEREAGAGAGLPDEEFVAAGARVVDSADEVWAAAGLVLKVKEPVAEEYHRLRDDQVLFTYLHLAASKECTDALITAGATAVAYETVRLPDGSLPLLAPMSEVAGRMAPQVGAHHLQRTSGGRGVLLGGVSGVPAGKIAVIGAGVSGMNAATIALGLQAEVMVLDTNINRLREIDFTYRGHLQTIMSNSYEVERACLWADLVIGAVLVPGAKAPTLVSSELVAQMRPGSVLVDIAIDQGGCFADSRPTTHDDPVFAVHDSVFYCVANMPGAVPNTSTRALTNVTLPYVLAIADRGLAGAVADDPALAAGVNVAAGRVVQPEVAAAHGIAASELNDVVDDLPAPR